MSKKRIAQLAGVDYHARTGPLQIGNDWPGVFIRGDVALFTWATILNQAVRDLTAPEGLAADGRHLRIARELHELGKLLKSCQLKGDDYKSLLARRP